MGLWAILVPWVWLWPGLAPDPAFFHAHELIFGMAGAALGGYLLTALPSWTAPDTGCNTNPRPPHKIGHLALVALVVAWGLGRGAMVAGAQGPVLLICAPLYPLGLSAVLLPPLLRGRIWQKLPLAMAPLALAVADLAWLSGRQGGATDQPFGLALVLGFALMISLVAGRAVPAFFNSRLGPSGVRVPVHQKLGALASGAIILSLGLLIAGHPPARCGTALVAAGTLQLCRFAAWRTRALLSHIDLLLLYLAWGWLAAGLMLLGFALRAPNFLDVPTALHALTIGAMGSMILAIAARAFMARAGGALRASAFHVAAFALIGLAAWLRLTLPDADAFGVAGLQWSVVSWSAGWALFLVPLLRNLTKASPHPVLSARRTRPDTDMTP